MTFLLPLLLLLSSIPAFSAAGAPAEQMDEGVGEPPLEEPPSPAVAEERANALAKKLRCPVCQGLSVADSRSDAALAMKERIEGLVAKGYTDEQVVDYFVGRYGEWALLKPGYEHWFVWMVPGVFVLGGLVVVLRRIGSSKDVGAASAATSEAPVDDYSRRILDELEEG